MRRLVLLSSILLTVASSAGATITTYKDSEFTRPATEFGDGDKVYFTVTESGITGGTRTVTITSNGSSLQSVTVSAYDHGLYYDKTADDGIFSGMFLVTTKLTIDPVNIESSEYPEGLCYKIVPNIHVDKDAAARIEADFDGNGSSQTASVKLLTLFNVEARAIADTSAVIFWNTGDSGYSRVEYGLTASYGSAAVKETPVKDLALSHYVTLTGLSPGTVYHYKVSSVDTYGNSHVSEDRTFTTRTGAEVEAAIRAARKDGGLPKTYYVKTDGSDSNDGLSIEKAWQHPSYAASKADAGDTIFLMGGTWNDEHLVFASSGIAIAPITLTTYGNGMSVLDGGDKTGYGLRFPGRSYINVSGIHLTNYYYGMAFEASVRDMHFSNYIIENTQSYGVEFVGPGPFSDISFSDFEMSGTGGYALSYGQGFNYSNIEIRDFYIHDTLSCGIYWRYGERVHVNDGKLYNTGSDPVCFSLSMYNSIMENIIVDHAGFHGVAVHDYTLGNNPCFNNIIRNCDISYANHNHIDLHSGAFNTLVENNTLHEESAFCTGIYFHNRGAGLIARNNHIYHVSRGFSGGGFAQYPLSDTLIYSNTVHDCFVHNFDMGADNQIIRDNILYNDPIGGEVCLVGSNILIENNDIDENRTYRTDVGTENILRDPKDSVYYMKSASVKLTAVSMNNEINTDLFKNLFT